MEQVAVTLELLPSQVLAMMSQGTATSCDDLLSQICRRKNSEIGELTGYDCPECLNRGGVYVIREEYMLFRECHCLEIRRSIQREEQSGIADMLKINTFDTFEASEAWQEGLKLSALNFLSDTNGQWFYTGGQNGCGKTHICTAIVGKLLKAGKSAQYMLWRDEVTRLKAVVTDDEEYARLINPLKTVDVLYIDDFLKTPRGEDGNTKPPSVGDLNVAFELLNYRYMNRRLTTIISSEHYIDALSALDEATGSRIYERSKGFCNNIRREKGRNYRLKPCTYERVTDCEKQ